MQVPAWSSEGSFELEDYPSLPQQSGERQSKKRRRAAELKRVKALERLVTGTVKLGPAGLAANHLLLQAYCYSHLLRDPEGLTGVQHLIQWSLRAHRAGLSLHLPCKR